MLGDIESRDLRGRGGNVSCFQLGQQRCRQAVGVIRVDDSPDSLQSNEIVIAGSRYTFSLASRTS